MRPLDVRVDEVSMLQIALPLALATLIAGSVPSRADETRDAIAATPSGAVVRKVHAVGAQIYDCAADGHGGLAWRLREPVATLFDGDRTVGRHFAGPTWEMADGSSIMGKVEAKAPGASAADIPWLRLSVSGHRGPGELDAIATVRRVETVGGVASGPCMARGALLAVPYAADYLFSQP